MNHRKLLIGILLIALAAISGWTVFYFIARPYTARKMAETEPSIEPETNKTTIRITIAYYFKGNTTLNLENMSYSNIIPMQDFLTKGEVRKGWRILEYLNEVPSYPLLLDKVAGKYIKNGAFTHTEDCIYATIKADKPITLIVYIYNGVMKTELMKTERIYGMGVLKLTHNSAIQLANPTDTPVKVTITVDGLYAVECIGEKK